MFPQLITGPIVCYTEIESQLNSISEKINQNQFALSNYEHFRFLVTLAYDTFKLLAGLFVYSFGGESWKAFANLMQFSDSHVLGGLWYGANWTFVIWRLYHGGLLIAYFAFRSWIKFEILSSIGQLVTFLLVVVGWVIFRSSDMTMELLC
ncbi:Peptidoglycan O-acetyltransferase [Gimesia aquarii]|uniref:Peptidoglycan O-acetyltransferase n=1 Tax=Gimesia aquarii TaxID=2527964 RepID=A0A517WWY3_9PLAN|nr:Peptidoglycan O-acetyltransferase [Gimesia aquarii]